MGERKIELIEGLKSFKQKISKRYKINKLILFGSWAWGRVNKDSDVDLILVSEDFRGISSLKRPCGFYLDWDLGYPVDFLCYTPEEFEKKREQISIVQEAVKEGIEIR